MKKLIFLFGLITVSFVLFSCASEKKHVKSVENKPVQSQKTVKIKKECENYVNRMEKCLKEAKGKDYRKIWAQCEGKVMWDMLKEYQDNGFCFDEDECKQKVLDEINNCKEERTYIFRKYYR